MLAIIDIDILIIRAKRNGPTGVWLHAGEHGHMGTSTNLYIDYYWVSHLRVHEH